MTITLHIHVDGSSQRIGAIDSPASLTSLTDVSNSITRLTGLVIDWIVLKQIAGSFTFDALFPLDPTIQYTCEFKPRRVELEQEYEATDSFDIKDPALLDLAEQCEHTDASFDQVTDTDTFEPSYSFFDTQDGQTAETSRQTPKKEYMPKNDFQLNTKLVSRTLATMLDDVEGRKIYNLLKGGSGIAFNKQVRVQLVKRIGTILFQDCNKQYHPTPDEVYGFAYHLLHEFEQIDLELLARGRTSYLGNFLQHRRSEFRKLGLLTLRTYSKKRALKLDQDESMVTMNESMQKMKGNSIAFRRLFDKTRDYRLAEYKRLSVEAFQTFGMTLQNQALILDDFGHVFSLDAKNISSNWTDRMCPVIEKLVFNTLSGAQSQFSEGFTNSFLKDDKAYRGMVNLLALLNASTCKKLAHVRAIYNHYPAEFSKAAALMQVKTEISSEVSVFQIGHDINRFYVNVVGHCIEVNGTFGDVIPILLAVHRLLDVKYPADVKNVYNALEQLIGVDSPKCPKTAALVVAEIRKNMDSNVLFCTS